MSNEMIRKVLLTFCLISSFIGVTWAQDIILKATGQAEEASFNDNRKNIEPSLFRNAISEEGCIISGMKRILYQKITTNNSIQQ